MKLADTPPRLLEEQPARASRRGRSLAFAMLALCGLIAGLWWATAEERAYGRLSRAQDTVRGALSRAQIWFYFGDEERPGAGRYGSLAELRAAGLLDGDTASGLVAGYRLRVVLDAEKQQVWHIAEPVEEPRVGFRGLYCFMRSPAMLHSPPQVHQYVSRRPIAVSSADFPGEDGVIPLEGMKAIASRYTMDEEVKAAKAASAARRQSDAVDRLAVDGKDQGG